LVSTLLAAPACGGEDFVAPSCEPGEVAVEGVIDGDAVSFRVATAGHAWINFASEEDNAYLDVYGPSADPVVHMEWQRSIANNQSADAFGYVDFSSGVSGSLEVGNCEGAGFVSRITARAEGADFLLQDLRRPPFCEGTPVDGELTGCVRFESF
jgi:hypothetical protein